MYDDNEELVSCARTGCPNEFVRFPSNKKYCGQQCKREAENSRRYFTTSTFTSASEPIDFIDDDIYDPIEDVTQLSAEVSQLYQKNVFLRKENTRLYNLSEKYKNSSNEAFDIILETIKNNVKSIQVNPTRTTSKVSDKAPKLVFNPWNSDTQIGKVTPAYSTQKAYENVELYTDYVIDHYKDFSQLYNISAIHVYFLGDIVEGENIFPTQPHLLDSSVFRQATIDGPQMYGEQLRRLLELGPPINVTAVIGNHGRLGRYANSESNMDRVLYQTLYWMFLNEPRINFKIPQGHGESMFWAVDDIGDYSTLLVHGDQFGPPSTQTSYAKKVLSWKAGGIPVKFDDVAMGHYHQNVKMSLGTTVVRISGSTESYNTYAQERIGVMSRPSQHLQIVDPKSGVFWESDIFLD
jgi:hypothetical protein